MAVKIWLLIIFGFFVLDLTAQTTLIQGKVADQNGQPLYLTLVYNADLGIGAYTDERGFFFIESDKVIPELEVFALGYMRERVNTKVDSSFITIKLKKLIYDLKEIEIHPCPKSEITMGLDLESIEHNLMRLSPTHGFNYQVGMSFPTRYGQEITAVEVHAINPGIRRTTFRLRIFELDSSGMPGNDLLLENLIVSVPGLRNKRPTLIDLKDYNLRSPDSGIFVAVEWLPMENNTYRTTGRHPSGSRGKRHTTLPILRLIRTEKNPDFKMWRKRDEGEWYQTHPQIKKKWLELNPHLASKEDQELTNFPAIKVHLLDCE
ncbi:MAG: hypothetical protein EA362_07145 [Saprospirales bacterium]|nr:MAG: hypothetical protein EA362_07145 [Saprospirales bacterium]